MKIKLDALYQKKKIEGQYKDCFLTKSIGYEPEELSISFVAELIEQEIELSIRISGELPMVCDRCLEKFSYKIDLSNKRKYNINEWGEEFDLDEELQQSLILSLPMKNLCRQDCKGLCPSCGKNLNTGMCGCKKEKPVVTDPRWQKLKKLKEN